MNPSEIIGIIGEPTRIIIDEDDNDQIIYEFNDQKIRLTFYKNENDRFGYFRTINPDLIYNNQKIINSKVDFVKKEIFGNHITDWEIEEYAFLTIYTNKDYWLVLHVEYGIVIDFQMGVPFKNEDEYDWPS